MKGTVRAAASMLAAAAVLSACASSPKKIRAAYVSPLKYQSLSCDQIALERSAVAYRSTALYQSLKRRATGDAAKMGVGVALFLPTLFFLKGNGAKAAEFADLKGDYVALRLNAEDRGCDIAFPDLEKVVAGKAEPVELTAQIEP
jgi:hypothetical protein